MAGPGIFMYLSNMVSVIAEWTGCIGARRMRTVTRIEKQRNVIQCAVVDILLVDIFLGRTNMMSGNETFELSEIKNLLGSKTKLIWPLWESNPRPLSY